MVEPRNTRYCPHCGQEVRLEDRFCKNCGHNLSAYVATPANPSADTGIGGFLHSFGLGAGGCIGCAVAGVLLITVLTAGCAILASIGAASH